MSNITLRDYSREIERLIEAGKYDEALAHCRHLLDSFPKHVDTYRQLSKTFLESKKSSNAEMVFKRILSIYPDDFISHLGLSLISEEQGDLNNSVVHMERAFEIQPSNINIQEELKRLYKTRDGVEPNRIRLTRGALIRMYARSNLFSQAISEIRIALHEHPQRIDLELILAKMLLQSNQKIEAVELCIQIVSKFPYCFEANKVLSDTLADASEAQDVKIFKQRLVEIDPYYKYTSKDQPDVYSVPDIAVSLNQIEIKLRESGDNTDWNSLIETYWLDKNESFAELQDEEEINWDEIIEKHFDVAASTKNDSVPPITLEEIQPLIRQDIKEGVNEAPFDVEEMPKEENIAIENIPEWLQIDDEGIKSTEITSNPLVESHDGDESSGLVDDDIPANPEIEQMESKPPSVWIQDANAESTNLLFQQTEKTNEEVKPLLNIEGNKKDKDRSQYFEVVLKDAHDALLSGFPQRSLECYQKLIKENQLIEELTNQLEQDLKQFSGNTPLWLILGDAFQKLGKSDQALEIYKKAESQFNNATDENE